MDRTKQTKLLQPGAKVRKHTTAPARGKTMEGAEVKKAKRRGGHGKLKRKESFSVSVTTEYMQCTSFNFNHIYIYRVLKQAAPEAKKSSKARSFMNSLVFYCASL